MGALAYINNENSKLAIDACDIIRIDLIEKVKHKIFISIVFILYFLLETVRIVYMYENKVHY